MYVYIYIYIFLFYYVAVLIFWWFYAICFTITNFMFHFIAEIKSSVLGNEVTSGHR